MAAEEFVDSTIAALKIIGMVPKSGKLCVRKGQLSLDDADNAQPVRRWFRGDSRDVTIMHARNVINSAVKISRAMMQAVEQVGVGSAGSTLAAWTLERLSVEMAQCEAGLQNLKTTYACDSAMVANLEVLSDRLRAHRAELVRFVDGPAAAAVVSRGDDRFSTAPLPAPLPLPVPVAVAVAAPASGRGA